MQRPDLIHAADEFPGVTSNGSVLIVTNGGDAALNGTYVLTNLSPQEQTDWQNNELDAATTGYVHGTNWADYYGGGAFAMLFGYDSGTGACTFWYDKAGTNLNGSGADWQNYYDTNLPPTTICPQIAAYQTFTVAAGGGTNLSVPPAAMLSAYDVVATHSIQIVSDQPVSVYGLNYNQFASAAFTAYPDTLLGTNYCLMARASSDPDGASELAIVATEDNTTVTISPSPTANLDNHASPYSTNLSQGETYQINSEMDTDDYYTNDVTGTWVTSDKPIGVYAGASVAFVPDNSYDWANPLVQEQMPVDSWGKQALAMGFAGRMNGDSYRVLAAADNTIVFTNGMVAGTNQTGQFLDLIIDGPVQFQASQPIQVAHFANGSTFSGEPGDPCEILLPPAGHYLETNIVFTPTNTPGFDENYLNLIVTQSAIANTLLNGSLLAATNFVPIATSGYYGAQIPVEPGTNTVNSSHPVGVEVYGFGTDDAYGYFGGVVK
jgi:hypothetical protein